MLNIGEINDFLKQGLSVTGVAKELGVPKTTLLRNLKKDGYVLSEKDGFKFYELITTVSAKQEKDSPQKVSTVGTKEFTLQDRIDFIKQSLSGIVHNFVSVSCELNYIYSNNLFKEKGFGNIVDFANSEFGLDRTKTYAFLKLYDRCIDSSSNLLKEDYKQFNYSQLVEIIYLPEEVEKEVSADMSVKQIREKKRLVKESKQHEEVQQPLEGQQTFIETEFEQVVDEVKHDEQRDYKKEFEALKEVFEKRSNRFREKEKELIELKVRLDSKVDLSLSISILEVAWSNEVDDNKANELRKQIDYIRSL